jgi:hypothetical protein
MIWMELILGVLEQVISELFLVGESALFLIKLLFTAVDEALTKIICCLTFVIRNWVVVAPIHVLMELVLLVSMTFDVTKEIPIVVELEAARTSVEIFRDDSANVVLEGIGRLADASDHHFKENPPSLLAEERVEYHLSLCFRCKFELPNGRLAWNVELELLNLLRRTQFLQACAVEVRMCGLIR